MADNVDIYNLIPLQTVEGGNEPETNASPQFVQLANVNNLTNNVLGEIVENLDISEIDIQNAPIEIQMPDQVSLYNRFLNQ